MTATIRALLDALDAIDLTVLADAPQDLADGLRRRQELLEALHRQTSTGELSEEERRTIAARLGTLLARDQQVGRKLQQALEDVGRSLGQMVAGRAAARGYAAAAGPKPKE